MPTRQAAIDEIMKLIGQTKKAFGGCEDCYGKGYSTQLDGYSDESTGKRWTEESVMFCNCDRGKALEKQMIKAKTKVADQICYLLDGIESHDENKSTAQWKQYKHIRNQIRDIYVLPYQNKRRGY